MFKVIVVEDEPIMRSELGQLLEFEGYEVVTASDGREGIEHIRATKPDIVLCDIGLPEVDGYGVLEWVRSDYEDANVPFVFLTAFRFELNRSIAEKLSCSAYLTKPFDIDELLNTLEKLLNKGV